MARDPKLFREMAEPFNDGEAANEAAAAFMAAVGEARKEHKITNVLCVVGFSYLNAEGDEVECVAPFTFGDSLRAESLSAYAFGFFSEQHKTHLASLVADGKKRGGK